MNSQCPSAMLEGQHREIDEGIAGIVDGRGTIPALAHSLALLRQHLYLEEAVLFPPLEAAGLTMPIFVMQREHGQMWPLLQRLEAGCRAGEPVDALRAESSELIHRLQIHNPKEEQIVYTTADRLQGERGDTSLADALAAAEVPEGWTCAHARRS